MIPMLVLPAWYSNVSGRRYVMLLFTDAGMYIRFVVGLNAIGAQLCAPPGPGKICIERSLT